MALWFSCSRKNQDFGSVQYSDLLWNVFVYEMHTLHEQQENTACLHVPGDSQCDRVTAGWQGQIERCRQALHREATPSMVGKMKLLLPLTPKIWPLSRLNFYVQPGHSVTSTDVWLVLLKHTLRTHLTAVCTVFYCVYSAPFSWLLSFANIGVFWFWKGGLWWSGTNVDIQSDSCNPKGIANAAGTIWSQPRVLSHLTCLVWCVFPVIVVCFATCFATVQTKQPDWDPWE